MLINIIIIHNRIWIPSKNTKICSAHFVDREKSSDPRKENYNPSIFPWKPETQSAVDRRKRLANRQGIKEILKSVQINFIKFISLHIFIQ